MKLTEEEKNILREVVLNAKQRLDQRAKYWDDRLAELGYGPMQPIGGSVTMSGDEEDGSVTHYPSYHSDNSSSRSAN